MPSQDFDASADSPLFAAGKLRATANADRTIPPGEVLEALARHLNGDWGDVSADDWQANDHAVGEGSRIVSVYRTTAGGRFYVITEADRSSTTVLLPEEY